jgi:hypothetical protein
LLNYLGAVAVGIVVASIVQPELIVESVAIIGKMAADSAKKMASDIAVTAGTHVVNEIGKDITEDIAKDAKVEASSTKTEVTQNETKVDEEKGTVVNTESKATSQKTKVVATGIAKPVTEASDAVPEASENGKDTEAGNTTQKEGDSKNQAKSESPAAEAPKKEISPNGEKEGTSVIVTGGGDKKVSVKISDNGTITIGIDSTSERKEVTETPPEKEGPPSNDAKELTPEVKISPPEAEKAAEKTQDSLTKEESKEATSSDNVPEEKENSPEAPAPSKENGEIKVVSELKEPTPETDKPAEAKTDETKSVKIVVKAMASPPEPAAEVSQPPPATGTSFSNSDQILAKIHQSTISRSHI